MSTTPPDEGFQQLDEKVEPLGPRRGKGTQGCARGCLIGCVIMGGLFILTSLFGSYACQRLVEQALIDDSEHVQRIADELAHFELPPGYQAEGALQVTGLGKLAFFTRPPDSGPGAAMLVIGRVDVKMGEKELIEEIQQARGGNSGDLKLETARCKLNGREAVCMDALMETDAEEPRIRWRSVVVPLNSGALVLVAADVAGRFDDDEAEEFFASVTLTDRQALVPSQPEDAGAEGDR